jgi:hypothetical protein
MQLFERRELIASITASERTIVRAFVWREPFHMERVYGLWGIVGVEKKFQ